MNILSTTLFSNTSQLFECTNTHIHTNDQMKTIRSQVPRNPRPRVANICIFRTRGIPINKSISSFRIHISFQVFRNCVIRLSEKSQRVDIKLSFLNAMVICNIFYILIGRS
jgi:hypothetical protein